MRLTITPADGAVYKNKISYSGLDLSFIPENIHALQWYETFGEVEFKRTLVNEQFIHLQNEVIANLPDWAIQAVTKWEEAEAAKLAAEEEERIAAEEAAKMVLEQEQNMNETSSTQNLET